MDELLELSPKLERDLYWTPCTLDSLQNPQEKLPEVMPEVIEEQKPFVFAIQREQVEPAFTFSREEAEEFIRVHFKDSTDKTIPELKETHGLTQQ